MTLIVSTFQSPVYRGGCCNPPCLSRSAPPCSEFQSPVYRGGCCNQSRPSRYGNSTFAFQSPVYRGGCCNAECQGGGEVLLFKVSIPCLSGRML